MNQLILMNTSVSVLLLFTIVSIISISPAAFADDSKVTIVAVDESGFSQACVNSGCYTPSVATVHVGDTVTMTNTDPTGVHTFTSGTVNGFSPAPDGTFDSGVLMSGDSFEWIPENAGEQPYYCMLHTWMIGTIIVQEAAAEEAIAPVIPMATVVESDQMMAEIITSDGIINQAMSIDLTLTDLEGNGIEHITYNIKAVQGTSIVLDEEGHMHKGTLTNNHITSVLPVDASDDMPVTITVESVGFGHNEQYVEASGKITTAQVVPEFGTIAMMILVVAIISIVAVTAKSRVVPRF
jgi:predicted secreted protein with PEFG-CTERM motif